MAYKRQFYPGESIPAKNRRRYMDPKQNLKKLRDIAMDDVVRIMGHRNPGEEYKSIHPPIANPIRAFLAPSRRERSPTVLSGHSLNRSREQSTATV